MSKHTMIILGLALSAAAILLGQEKPAPLPSIQLTADQRAVISEVNAKAQALQKEQETTLRAIAAERQILQLRITALVQEVCPAGEKCQLSVNDPDPSKWVVAVIPKSPVKAAPTPK